VLIERHWTRVEAISRSTRYQRVSIRREKRSAGKEVWVWHYRVKGIMRQEVHPVAEYKTESALWKHIVPSIKLLNEGAEKPVLVAATRVTSSLATNLNT
jgi:hypothetical protein